MGALAETCLVKIVRDKAKKIKQNETKLNKEKQTQEFLMASKANTPPPSETAGSPETAPSLAPGMSLDPSPTENANNVVSDINVGNTTAVDDGQNVSEAAGEFVCERFGDLQFRFKGAQMFSASTVVLKWRVAGNSGDGKVVGEKGSRTTKQAVNTAVVKLVLGPILGPMMMGPEAITRDNEIELTVWSEQLYTLKACPGVTLRWNFTVKNGGKVDFNVAHRIDLVKSLRYNEELVKAWTQQQHKMKNQVQMSQQERVRIQKEVQESEAGKKDARRKAEELKRQLKSQAELAHQKLTKLLKDQEQARRLNADKDEVIADFTEKVNTLEIQRLGYIKQVNDLSDCLKNLQTEKGRCVEELWKQREIVASKDQELTGQAQTLRALETQLEKYRESMAESAEENTKLSDEIDALLQDIEQHKAANQTAQTRFTKDRVQQQTKIGELNAALLKASDESNKQRSKTGELVKQQEHLKSVLAEKEKRIAQVHEEYHTARDSLEKATAALNTAQADLDRQSKAMQWAKQEHAQTKSESEDRIATLEQNLKQLEKCAKQNQSDQSDLHNEVERQLQQDRARCTKLGNANSSLREHVTKLRADLEKANQDYKSTTTRLEKDLQRARESMQQQEAKAAAAKSASETCVAAQADAEARLAKLVEESQLLKRQHDAKFEHQQAVIKQLRANIADLLSKIQNNKTT